MTPMGDPVAMVHCNNGCGELDKWVELFGGDYASLLLEAVEKGDADCGGITATNWISAEPLAGVDKPFPYLTHTPAARLTRANIIRAELKAVFATLAKGMELLRAEGVYPTSLTGHGGLFKTRGVAERILSEMLGIPVATRATAGEGGAWGIAVLAAYHAHVLGGGTLSLVDFLHG
jgi:sugar (pentulose or hexulose) kinase